MKVWIISGEGMPVYGYWLTEEDARAAWAKVHPWDEVNTSPYGTHIYALTLMTPKREVEELDK